MAPETATLLVGVLFLLIAIVGGGFTVKEIKMPPIPKWARIVSAVLGLGFVVLFVFITLSGKINKSTPSSVASEIIYTNNKSDVSPHGIEFLELEAKAAHNPPLVNDLIVVTFSIKNVSGNPIELDSGIILMARNPDDENTFIPRMYGYTIFDPEEVLEVEFSVIVDKKGSWVLSPCYSVLDKSILDGFCPEGWNQFPISVH